jgi:hypothetical protein
MMMLWTWMNDHFSFIPYATLAVMDGCQEEKRMKSEVHAKSKVVEGHASIDLSIGCDKL